MRQRPTLRSNRASAAGIILCALFIVVSLAFAATFCSYFSFLRERLLTDRHVFVKQEAALISRLLLDSSTSMGGYSISLSPRFKDRFHSDERQILNEIRNLGVVVRNQPKQAQILKEVALLAGDEVKILNEAQQAIDGPFVWRCRISAGRHRYKQISQIQVDVDKKLTVLTAEDSLLTVWEVLPLTALDPGINSTRDEHTIDLRTEHILSMLQGCSSVLSQQYELYRLPGSVERYSECKAALGREIDSLEADYSAQSFWNEPLRNIRQLVFGRLAHLDETISRTESNGNSQTVCHHCLSVSDKDEFEKCLIFSFRSLKTAKLTSVRNQELSTMPCGLASFGFAGIALAIALTIPATTLCVGRWPK